VGQKVPPIEIQGLPLTCSVYIVRARENWEIRESNKLTLELREPSAGGVVKLTGGLELENNDHYKYVVINLTEATAYRIFTMPCNTRRFKNLWFGYDRKTHYWWLATRNEPLWQPGDCYECNVMVC